MKLFRSCNLNFNFIQFFSCALNHQNNKFDFNFTFYYCRRRLCGLPVKNINAQHMIGICHWIVWSGWSISFSYVFNFLFCLLLILNVNICCKLIVIIFTLFLYLVVDTKYIGSQKSMVKNQLRFICSRLSSQYWNKCYLLSFQYSYSLLDLKKKDRKGFFHVYIYDNLYLIGLCSTFSCTLIKWVSV